MTTSHIIAIAQHLDVISADESDASADTNRTGRRVESIVCACVRACVILQTTVSNERFV